LGDALAKTTVTTRKIDIVDLIRDRKLFQELNVPAMRVQVVIEVTTSALLTTPPPVASAKMDRLEKAARAKLDEYEKIISQECEKFCKKIVTLIYTSRRHEAEQMVREVNMLVRNALRSAEGAAMQAVEETKRRESQGDKLLLEARVKTTVSIVFNGVSIATNVARLAATAGADVTAYLSIIKTLVLLGKEIRQQLKDEEQLKQDLEVGISDFLGLRKSVLVDLARKAGLMDTASLPGFPEIFSAIAQKLAKVGKNLAAGRDAKSIAKEIYDFAAKSVVKKWNEVETARQKYRNHTVKMRQNVDSVSLEADKLMVAMRTAKNLTEGVRVGAECMQMKGEVKLLAGQLERSERFLAESEATMKGYGLDCDDRTVIAKIQELDVKTILLEGGQLVRRIDNIYKLVEAVSSAV